MLEVRVVLAHEQRHDVVREEHHDILGLLPREPELEDVGLFGPLLVAHLERVPLSRHAQRLLRLLNTSDRIGIAVFVEVWVPEEQREDALADAHLSSMWGVISLDAIVRKILTGDR